MRVVIAGGGAGALAAYIGLFRKLKDIPGGDVLFSKFDWIGSSAGALALYAYAADILDKLDARTLFNCSDQVEAAINIVDCVENNRGGLISRESMRGIIKQFVTDEMTINDVREKCGTSVSMITSKLSFNGDSYPCILDGDRSVLECMLDSMSVPGIVEPRVDEEGTMYVDGDLTYVKLLKSDDILISLNLFQIPLGEVNIFNVLIASLNYIHKSIRMSNIQCMHINIGVAGSLFLYSIEHAQEYIRHGEIKAMDLFSILMVHENKS